MSSSIAYTNPPTPPATGKPAWAPPLDIARTHARTVLDEANRLDLEIADSLTLAREFGGVCEALRQVLAALDAEDRRDA